MDTETKPRGLAQPGTRRLKHIRMPSDVEATLKAYAEAQNITFNAAVVHFLKEATAANWYRIEVSPELAARFAELSEEGTVDGFIMRAAIDAYKEAAK